MIIKSNSYEEGFFWLISIYGSNNLNLWNDFWMDL